jgi:molybdate transport system substrate-binding protein
VIGRPAAQVWSVPEDYYPAIRQDAVLLTAGADDAAARAFMAFLHGEAAAAIIRGHGYDVPR